MVNEEIERHPVEWQAGLQEWITLSWFFPLIPQSIASSVTLVSPNFVAPAIVARLDSRPSPILESLLNLCPLELKMLTQPPHLCHLFLRSSLIFFLNQSSISFLHQVAKARVFAEYQLFQQ